jgi:hypothetical protein
LLSWLSRIFPRPVRATAFMLNIAAEHTMTAMEGVIGNYFRARDELEPVAATELVTRLRKGSVVLLDVRPSDEYVLAICPTL